MRTASFPATVIATGCLGFGLAQVGLALLPAAPLSLPVWTGGGPGVTAPDPEPAPWPALFGTAPPAPLPAAPEPEPSARYVLKGLVARDTDGWALVSGAGIERLVRPGDVLPDGARVAGIDRHGVTLDRDGAFTRVGFEGAGLGLSSPPVDTAATPADPDRPAPPVARSELRLEGLGAGGLRRMLARAGAIEQVETADGARALDLIWIRKGQLFDRLGLRSGDRILRVNGVAVGDDAAVLGAADRLLTAAGYRIELLRNGAPLVVEVAVRRD